MSTAPQLSTEKKWNPRVLIVANASFFVVFLAIALLLMRKWHSPQPWSALDANVIAIIALSLIYAVQQLILYPTVFKTKRHMDLFVGKHFDPRMPMFLGILGAIELAAFVDYAHWHLIPALRIGALQTFGLAIMFLGIGWLFYVDRYMGSHFLDAWNQHRLMTGGPYRFVRHPRYLALLLSRVGFCLAIASIIAYIVLPGWFFVVWLRVRREELYLRQEFGHEYDQFASSRARLLPGIY